MYLCRYKDGYEENLTLWRLRQLGAAFKYPRPSLTPGKPAQGGQQDGGESVGGNGGGVWKFRRATKHGAERVINAVRLGTLWGHRGKETVVAVSIYDDPEVLIEEIISLLALMKTQGQEIGVTYWESPERKCLNECRLPLPELPTEAINAVGYANGGAAGGGGSGNAGAAAGAAAERWKDSYGRELGPGWVESPGAWKEPRHCHSGGLIVWKTGVARYRAKGAGDFQEHCCAALLGSRNVPVGAEAMLLDGFFHGTGILQNNAVYRAYKRRGWVKQLFDRGDMLPALPTQTTLPPSGHRFLVKKVGLQVGHVPRRKESIYVCAAAPAAIMEAPRSTPGLCAGEASAAPTPSIQGAETNGSASAITPTHWWTLRGDVPHGEGVPMDVAGGGEEDAKPYHPHFWTCIVCQKGGSMSKNISENTLGNGPGSGRGPGSLLLCSTCPASFHLSCLRPRMRTMPDGHWSCAYCYATGRAKGGDSDGACGAVRLMESLRQGMHGAVRVNTVRTLRYNAIG